MELHGKIIKGLSRNTVAVSVFRRLGWYNLGHDARVKLKASGLTLVNVPPGRTAGVNLTNIIRISLLTLSITITVTSIIALLASSSPP